MQPSVSDEHYLESKTMMKNVNTLIALLLSLTLISCSSSSLPDHSAGPSTFDEHQQVLASELQNKGVSFMRLGDDILIVAPSELIFSGDSPKISARGTGTLKLIAKVIAPMTKVSINIAAYYPGEQSRKALTLTSAQALKVSNYLWRAGVDARLMIAKGYGGGHPIKSKSNDGENYRVEIRLQDLTYSSDAL